MRFWKRSDQDFHAEIEGHLRLEADRLIADGMDPKSANAAARRTFGNVVSARERFYEAGRWQWVEELRRDLRYGLRSLAKTPSFTVVAALTIALGVGANTAVFSLVEAVMLRPLPVSRPSELVFISTAGSTASLSTPPYPTLPDLREKTTAFSGIAAFATDEMRIEIAGRPEPVNGQIATQDYFQVLDIQPAAGRLFAPGDEEAADGVAVISDRYWKRRFGGDPAAIGTSIVSGAKAFTIVGVTPPGFEGLRPGFAVDLTLPMPRRMDGLGGHSLIARRRPEVSPAAAEAETLAVLQGTLAQLGTSSAQMDQRFRTVQLRPGGYGESSLRDRFERPLLALMGIAALVLLLASANIANLLLARGFSRLREFAIRLAAGAGRWRLVRQTIAETLLLFAIGAVPGIVLAYIGVGAIEGMFAEGRRSLTIAASLNWRVLGFAVLVTLAAGIVAALFPAWRVLRSELEQVIREGQTRSSESRAASTLRHALVAIQVAVSLVLLVTAVTFLGTLSNLRDTDRGFQNASLLTMSVELPEGYVESGRSPATWDRVAAALRTAPGVKLASLSTFTPLSGRDRFMPITVRGHDPGLTGDRVIHFNHVSEGFFETLGLPLLEGRTFTELDREGSPRVAIVNESAVRKFFRGRSPQGEILRFGPLEYRIVGVVRDSKHRTLREPAAPFAYLPLRQARYPEHRITLSAAPAAPGGESALLPAIRQTLAEVDPGLMIYEVISMERQLEATLLTERLLSSLASGFGGLAMVLAALGLYGVLSYRIGQQRQAIGIQMALGASPGSVAWTVVRQSAAVTAIGVACGLPFAILAARTADSLLWGVTSNDPAIYGAGAILLACVAMLSAWLPARRASAIEPAEALRHG